MAAEKPTILIVEDEPPIIELVTFTLKGAGWNVAAVPVSYTHLTLPTTPYV